MRQFKRAHHHHVDLYYHYPQIPAIGRAPTNRETRGNFSKEKWQRIAPPAVLVIFKQNTIP